MFEVYIGLAIMIAVWFFDRDLLRIQWNSVASFCGFMTFVTLLRICWFDFQIRTGSSYPAMPAEIYQSGIWSLGLVFWEDAFYAIPIYYAHKHLKSWPAWGLTIALSLMFASGHTYQGYFVASLTAFYPYFISNRFGAVVGFGTVMACHIIYDMLTFLVVHLSPILIP